MSLAPAMFVHPHPDDESIACGGLIAASVADGRAVTVVTCTGGEVGENQSGIDLGGRSMGDVRRQEMAEAIVALGSPEHRWLGFWDSGMEMDDGKIVAPAHQHVDSFHGADLDAAAGRLAQMIRQARPALVVSDDESGTYGHPDHIKANQVTVRAVELAADPQWGRGAPWRVARRAHHTLSQDRMIDGHNRMLEAGL
ncbi:MAG: N-acetyl-1-D-myo-inositol-2-amino-2-deoxy-alpha-D-glucopyranoside deacetylase, partial [Glaciecola sp.]